MTAPDIIGDVFAGVAATAGAVSVLFARRTVTEARAATAQLEKANADASLRFAAEARHRVLMQLETIADLLAELGREAVTIATPDRFDRYHVVRRQFVAAIVVLRELGGPNMADQFAVIVNNEIGFASTSEIEVAQAALVDALKTL